MEDASEDDSVEGSPPMVKLHPEEEMAAKKDSAPSNSVLECTFLLPKPEDSSKFFFAIGEC